VNVTVNQISERVPAYFDYNSSLNRVLKSWYEQRIEEETNRNRKLRELHDNLTAIKLEQKHHAMNATMDTQALISGQA